MYRKFIQRKAPLIQRKALLIRRKAPLITVLTMVLVLVFSLSLTPALAKKDSQPIPEKNGVYDDPDHPGVKVRVYVHPQKPDTTTAASLVCNLSDPNSTSVVGAAGWHLPPNWTYNLNPSSVPASVGSANLGTIASNGFADWSAAASGKVTFAPGSNTSVNRSAYDGKNIVAFGRTSSSALGVTYIRYYSSTGLVVDVDTILNQRVPWSWSNLSNCADSNSYDAENILTHEIGHWIGMDDEYAAIYQDATMFGYGSKGEVKKNTLTTGDTTGAAAIYP